MKRCMGGGWEQNQSLNQVIVLSLENLIMHVSLKKINYWYEFNQETTSN